MTFDNLKKGDSIFIDANIFVYNFGAQSAECKELLLRCARGELIGCTLTSVLSEVFHRLMIAEAIEKGQIVDDFDILIAAITLSNNGVLVTNNIEHFKRVKQLKYENWLVS